jgi:UDP-N-acetylmuramyl tripeptide synthase
LGVAVVSGSAGKSSTTKALVEIVRAHGLSVFTNPSTSNIRQGFYSSILQFGDWRGRLTQDIAILEWDEGHGAVLAKSIHPKLAVLTNILSDQLDRFIDPELVAEKLRVIADQSEMVVANGDDRNLTQFLSGRSKATFFGLSPQLQSDPAAPKYALNFGPNPRVELSLEVREVSDQIEVQLDGEKLRFKPLGLGFPQALNTAAAVLAAKRLLPNFQRDLAVKTLAEIPAVFARDERVTSKGQELRLLLVQNPTSFQLNLDLLEEQPEQLMILVGTDIHDPSWLWTVDFSRLKLVDVLGGYNAHALAVRLQYQGVEIGSIVESVPDAVDTFMALAPSTVKTVLFSADGMRRMRRHLRLAK